MSKQFNAYRVFNEGEKVSGHFVEMTLAFSASSEDMARTIHAHPSLSEAVHEAALAVGKRVLHI